jgi:hypothetical protein
MSCRPSSTFTNPSAGLTMRFFVQRCAMPFGTGLPKVGPTHCANSIGRKDLHFLGLSQERLRSRCRPQDRSPPAEPLNRWTIARRQRRSSPSAGGKRRVTTPQPRSTLAIRQSPTLAGNRIGGRLLSRFLLHAEVGRVELGDLLQALPVQNRHLVVRPADHIASS